MKVKQHKLKQGDKTIVTWLEIDKRVKVGTIITLKNEVGNWLVEDIFNGEFDKEKVTEKTDKVFGSIAK